MNENVMEISYTSKIQVEKVSLKDFPHKSFEKSGYTIVELKNGKYGIVKNGFLEEVFIKFDIIIENRICQLYLENGLQKLVSFKYEKEIVFSKPFKEIKKIFRKYILVELEDGKRFLMDIYRYYGTDLDFFEWEKGMCASKHGGSTNHAILELPNGKYTILTKDGLNYSKLEFESVANFFDEDTNDKFRIVTLEKGKKVLVRICDLKESSVYHNIDYYSYGYCNYSDKYVKVYCENYKTIAVLRISDLEVSKEYNDILGLSREFAMFQDGEKKNILRLTDFKEAKWCDD